MIPIVFCASFAPCESEKKAELASCAARKKRSTRAGDVVWKIHMTMIISDQPRNMPMSGESTMKTSVLVQPERMSAWNPAFATAAPP